MIEFVDRPEHDTAPAASDVPLTARTEAGNGSVFQVCRTSLPLLKLCTTSLVLAFLAGCGDGKPVPLKVVAVSGVVKFQGQPAPGAIVTFFPKDTSIPEDVRPNAIADEAGHFDLGTYSDTDGAPEGEYDVSITWRPLVVSGGSASPGPNRLPVRYSQPETSQLTVKVNDEDTELKPFDLAP